MVDHSSASQLSVLLVRLARDRFRGLVVVKELAVGSTRNTGNAR
jgi:hypothetical protein